MMSSQTQVTTPQTIHEQFVQGVLRPYQRVWLRDILYNRYTYNLGARQIGKSLTVSYTALCLSMGYEDENILIPAHDVLIISKDQRTAQSMIREINRHLDAWERLGVNLRHKTKGSESRIALINGSEIRAMPGKAKAIQGFHGSVLIDELEASEADPEDTLAQASFVASSQPHYRIAIITNAGPAGGFTDNLLNSEEDIWRERRDMFVLSNTSIYDAYPDGLPSHILDMQKVITSAAWKRFYLNMAVEGLNQLLDSDQIRACKQKHKIVNGERILSVDAGFVSNPSGVVVIEVGGGKANILYAAHWFAVSMEDQIENMKQLMQEFNVTKIIIDKGAQGFQMAKALEARYPTMTISKTTNRSTRNRDGATIQRLVQERNIWIPNNTGLIEDLESILLDDNMNVELPERPAPPSSNGTKHKIHADIADALFMTMEYVASTYSRTQTAAKNINIGQIAVKKFW